MVPRGGNIVNLESIATHEDKIEALRVPSEDQNLSLLDIAAMEKMDGIIVIKGDQIVYEHYFNDFKANQTHTWFSMTKSLTATLLGILVEDGVIDLKKKPSHYVAELKGSVFDRVTIQQTLDMVTGLDYIEDYVNPTGLSAEYLNRLGLTFVPEHFMVDPRTDKETPISVLDIIPRFGQIKENIGIFQYQSPHVDVISWVMQRATGKGYQALLSELIWSKIGAAHDAYVLTDPAFVPFATGGMMSTLRDAAKFALLIKDQGKFNDQQIIPSKWIAGFTANADKQIEATNASVYKTAEPIDTNLTAYHNFWWIDDLDQKIYTARGIFGQTIYINESQDIAIVSFSSAEHASTKHRPVYGNLLELYDKIAEAVEAPEVVMTTTDATSEVIAVKVVNTDGATIEAGLMLEAKIVNTNDATLDAADAL